MRYAIPFIALLLGAALWLSPDRPAPRPHPVAAPPGGAHAAAHDPMPEVLTDRARYRLEYRREMRFNGHPLPGLSLTADLQIQGLAHRARQEFTLSDVRIAGPEGSPGADALGDPFHVARADGRPLQIGFRDAVPHPARALLGSLVGAIQLTEGQGDAWSALEDDTNGRYEAIYRRRDGIIERSRTYVSLRTATGLARHLADAVTVTGATRFDVDARGLVSVELDEQATMTMGEAPLAATITLRLVRTDVRQVAATFGDRLTLGGLVAADRATARPDEDAALLGDHTVDSLLDAFTALADLPERSHETSKWRNGQLLRLRALVRARPEAVARLITEIRDRGAAGEQVAVDLLVGGLAEASTPAAVEGLLSLAGDADLDAISRRRVAMGLGTLETPSAETARALGELLADDSLGSTPPLALGNQARTLSELDPEAAGDAVDQLIAGYTRAESVAEKRVYLGALGNAGDLRALPIMQEALGGHPALAEAAAFGLRYIPGQAAEALLAGLLQSPGPSRLRIAAVNAIERRDAAAWQPLLVATLEREADAAVRQAIERVLAVLPA